MTKPKKRYAPPVLSVHGDMGAITLQSSGMPTPWNHVFLVPPGGRGVS